MEARAARVEATAGRQRSLLLELTDPALEVDIAVGQPPVDSTSVSVRAASSAITVGRARGARWTGGAEAELSFEGPDASSALASAGRGWIAARGEFVGTSIGKAGAPSSRLHGRLDLREVSLRTAHRQLALQGSAQLRGSDAWALIAVAAPAGAHPALEPLLKDRSFTVQAEVERRNEVVELLPLTSDVGPFRGRGGLVLGGARAPSGALLLRSPWYVAGMTVDGGQLRLARRPGDAWLARQLDALR